MNVKDYENSWNGIDELRAPETDDEEPWRIRVLEVREGGEGDLRAVIYTVAVLVGLTLAAIAWRMLR